MSDKPTYMDCWHFIAPLIPVNTDYTMDIYIMVFNALKEAEKKRIAEKKGGRKATHETFTLYETPDGEASAFTERGKLHCRFCKNLRSGCKNL